MKKIELLILLTLLGVTTILAQNVVDFEDLTLDSESHWDGSDLSGSFTSGFAAFFNNYDVEYSMWDGFAYTNETDAVTYSYVNQYSSASGSGADASSNYAVSWVSSDWMNGYDPIPVSVKINTEIAPEIIPGMFVSLNAYSNLYMADNDFYADEKHWLKLEITAYNSETDFAESKEIILSDYRFVNSEDGFKFDTWQYVNMTWAQGADSLTFIILSSDSGEYGITTPTYFCLDNIGAETPVGVPELETEILDSYSISSGESVSISALAKGGVQPFSFEWSSEAGLDDYYSQTAVANPTETTTWNVTVTDALGSESTGSLTVFVGGVSVAQNELINLNMYFNATDILVIESDIILDELSVFDMTGKHIYSITQKDFNYAIDFSMMSSGMYVVKIVSNGMAISRKIVK